MSEFVLVHGAWHGGWSWDRVAAELECRGHRVFRPSLTGLAERSHLLTRDVDLSTHVADIVTLVEFEGLHGIVLCGHSYGGMVITGALERIAHRVVAAVYLDAFLPASGESCADILGKSFGAGLAMDPPSADTLVTDPGAQAWVRDHMTPHPIASLTERLELTGRLDRIAHKYYIKANRRPPTCAAEATYRRCTEAAYQRCAADSGWTVAVLDGEHDLMIDRAKEVSAVLCRAAKDGETVFV